MKDVQALLAFLLSAAARGERTALVTLTDIVGRGARAPGAHMAVSESGAYLGSLSTGCVERAIVGEARRIMAHGRAEQLRIGVGSPFIDLVLPCGGGMNLLFTPAADAAALAAAQALLASRQPVCLRLGQDGSLAARPAAPADAIGWCGDAFLSLHEPALRIVAAAHGPEALALTKLGIGYGAEITILSPDRIVLSECAEQGATVTLLQPHGPGPALDLDPYSAVALLLHDLELEAPILLRALAQAPFFIGAMGSRQTHARRLRMLEQRGVPGTARAAIVSPIGLIPAARDPETLALSALAQIVARFNARPPAAPGAAAATPHHEIAMLVGPGSAPC